jgi:hypothetical protein
MALRRNVQACRIGGLPLQAVTSASLDQHFRLLEKRGTPGGRPLGPSTIMHVRGCLRVAFSKARKAGIWCGVNPVSDTQSRRIPKRAYETLTADEVPRMLAHAGIVAGHDHVCRRCKAKRRAENT